MARPRAADHAGKRQTILHEAAKLFAAQGFDRTSLSDIAIACGTSKALFYHYYASKEALLTDIIQNHLDELIDGVRAAAEAQPDPRLRLRAIIGALLDAYRDADAEHKIQINELSYLPEETQRTLKGLERILVDLFADSIGKAVPELGEKPALLKPVTMSLFGMLNWHFMWFRPQGSLSREAYADLAARLIMDGARGLV